MRKLVINQALSKRDEVMAYSPTLADKVALNTAMFTTDQLVKELSDVLK